MPVRQVSAPGEGSGMPRLKTPRGRARTCWRGRRESPSDSLARTAPSASRFGFRPPGLFCFRPLPSPPWPEQARRGPTTPHPRTRRALPALRRSHRALGPHHGGPRRRAPRLIGPNGAGKTSVLNCISGLYRAQEGTITLTPATVPATPLHRLPRTGSPRWAWPAPSRTSSSSST